MDARAATCLTLSVSGLVFFLLAGGCGGAIAPLAASDDASDDGSPAQFLGDDSSSVVDVSLPPIDVAVYPPDASVTDAWVDGKVTVCAAVSPGGVTTGKVACDDCLATSCCAEATTCAADDCVLILQCVTACVADGGTTQSCAPMCVAMYPNGVNDALVFQQCATNNCATACM